MYSSVRCQYNGWRGGYALDISLLATLLEEHRYGDCRDSAAELLRTGDLTGGEKAQAFLALSYSLAALQSGQEAVSPAELAVYFSREAADYDLTGRALFHLAKLYGENNLPKRAIACLDEYFQLFGLYRKARALEGRVLAHLALLYQSMGRTPKALDYGKRAFQWHVENDGAPRAVEEQRGRLIWLLLKLGQVDTARELLAASNAYLRDAPNDLEARACFLNNQAYRYFLLGSYTSAIDTAVQVMEMRSVSAVWRAYACLTLHYTARALGQTREALGFGTLARIQATLARRTDLEQETVRSMLHIQQQEGLPYMDELLRSLRQRRAK